MKHNYKIEIDIMTSCMKNIGAVLMKYFEKKNYKITMKSAHNPLTEADLMSNSLLIETIQEYFPEDAILSEETSVQDSSLPNRFKTKRVWIIDPIDGTKEFIRGVPEFSVSVALVEENQPVLGFIFNPAQKFFIHGGKGIGIFINSCLFKKDNQIPQQIEDIYPCFSRSEFKRGLLNKYLSQLSICDEQIFGSIAYKLGMVASGKFNLTISYSPKNEWDIAAGLCLFEELGYIMTDLDLKKITLNKTETRSGGIIGGHSEAIRLYHIFNNSNN